MNNHPGPLHQSLFVIEKMLGRPIKKYNVLIITKEGQHLTSSDDRKDKDIARVVKNAGNKCRELFNNPFGAFEFKLVYDTTSKSIGNKKFYMMVNIGDDFTHSSDRFKDMIILSNSFSSWKE